MKAKKSIIRLSILSIIIFNGCQSILEDDISSQRVVLLSPADSCVTSLINQTFWWESISGADYYDLQIVSPSFYHPEKLWLDTMISTNKLTITLPPGIYQWRVDARNFAYNTAFSTFRLTIDSTLDISKMTVELLTPAVHDTTNKPEVTFSWERLYCATNYNFKLSYEGTLIYDTIVEQNTLTRNLMKGDGTYNWKVRGQNSSSNTLYGSRIIFLDTQPPGSPLPLSPQQNAIFQIDSIISFRWIRATQVGSRIYDSLIIYVDSSLFAPVYKFESSETFLYYTFVPGIYFWRIKSIDVARNQSDFCSPRKFTVNP